MISLLPERNFFYLRSADEKTQAAFVRHTDRIDLEMLPDDPLTPLEKRLQSFHVMPDIIDILVWPVWNDGNIVASGRVRLINDEPNRNSLYFFISVEPKYRCQGLGRALLGDVARFAARENRTLLFSSTNSLLHSGELFLERIGGKRGLESKVHQLDLSKIDRAMVDDWIRKGIENAQGFEFGFWDGPYPEADIVEFIDLINYVITAVPIDDLDQPETIITVEEMRQFEASRAAQGSILWTTYIRDLATGTFVGFSEIYDLPGRGAILLQSGTGVRKEYQGRGFGKWLKAAMIERILLGKPAARFIRTTNANSNAPMRRINEQLGFAPFYAETQWQVALRQVQQYLGSAG